MHIAYFGDSDPGTTAMHRAKALQRLGHDLRVFDIAANVQKGRVGLSFDRLHFHTGYRFLQHAVLHYLSSIKLSAFDLAWVNSGEMLGPNALDLIKKNVPKTVLYVNDDPTGCRDGHRFVTLRKCLQKYDLCAVVRLVNVSEFNSLGARKVIRVHMSFDEVEHSPYTNVAEIPPHLRSEVSFIGTWMRGESRDTFVARLLDLGIPVALWGGRWQRSPLWEKLNVAYRGEALVGRNYVGAIQGAKLCLGFLSKGNRDLHTRRSAEIPYANGILCAQRTSEHLNMYREGEEAVFWDTPEECASKCEFLLASPGERQKIRIAGNRRVTTNRLGNEDVCGHILESV